MVRVRGVQGTDLADAYVAGTRAARPTATRHVRTVAGLAVQRLQWTESGTATDQHVVAIGDLAYVIGGPGNQTAAANNTIAWLARPRLDLLLPETIGAKPMQRTSLPASAIPTGGDTCSVICPGEIQALSQVTGVPVEDIDLAFAIGQDRPGVLVVAFRIPGASDRQLIEARVSGFSKPWDRGTQTIGGKKVTWVLHDPFPNSGQNEYLYARNGVVYSIRPYADDGHPNPLVVEAIQKLP